MENQNNTYVSFDYTNFLGISCRKKWTFTDILYFICPWLKMPKGERVVVTKLPEARLWEEALKVMSSRRSDESNIITLTKLARLEGIDELRIAMPYSLEARQIAYIRERSHSDIDLSAEDELMIHL